MGAGYLHRLPLDTTRAVTQVGEGSITPTISGGVTQTQGQAHDDHGHAHGDHGHAHGAHDDHGHAHGGHDDHGHAHGAHDDHGHAHGAHDDHGHAHGAHDDHGHTHGAHDDHGHAHGAHDDHGHAHGDHGHAHHAAAIPAAQYATSTAPYTMPASGQPAAYQQPQPQPQQPSQTQPHFPTHPSQYTSFAPATGMHAGQASYTDAAAPGLFTQELYGAQGQTQATTSYGGAAAPYVPAAYPAAGAPYQSQGLSVQAPLNAQYPAASQFAAPPAYLQQAPNQQVSKATTHH